MKEKFQFDDLPCCAHAPLSETWARDHRPFCKLKRLS
jgi:hypothetical protein